MHYYYWMNFANPKLGACVHLELIRHLPPLQQEKHPSSHRLEWPPLPSEVSPSCAHTTNRATHFRTEEKATVVKGAIHAPLTISLSAQLKIWVGKTMTSKRFMSLFSMSKFILLSTATSLQLKNSEVQVWEKMTRCRNFQSGFATRGKKYKKFHTTHPPKGFQRSLKAWALRSLSTSLTHGSQNQTLTETEKGLSMKLKHRYPA